MKHETRVAESEKSFQKITQVQTRVENYFFFSIFYAKQRRLKRCGETVG